MTSLQSLLDETEKRTEQVQRAKEGIVNTEIRLADLSKQIDDKFDILQRITKTEIESSSDSAPVNSRLSPKDRETIIQLKRMGWTVEEIARRYKRTVGEIEMVIEMGI